MWTRPLCLWWLQTMFLIIGNDGASESDPWITPIPNLNAAMEGFDPIMSNPLERPDPGIRNQIFEPMSQLPSGRVVVNSFIDKVREDLHCDAELSGKTLRNYNEYSIEKSSSHRFSLNANVSVKTGFWIFSFSASAGYGSHSTEEESSVQKLFQEANGEIIENKAECITHSVGISLFEKPVFTAAFTTALRELHFAAKTAGSESSRTVYVKFVQSYGTHFMKSTFLGSKLIFEKRFTTKTADSSEQSARSECVTNSAYASLGVKVMTDEVAASFEMSSKRCEKASESKSFFQNNGFNSEKVISIGPLPHGDLEKWSNTVKESPVPIYYELEKISSLFQSKWFNTITTDDTDPNAERLNGTAMYDFFEDNSVFFCQLILGEECDVAKKGCGYNSLCGRDQTCVSDQTADLGYTCNDMNKYGPVLMMGGHDGKDTMSSGEAIDTWTLPNLPYATWGGTLSAAGSKIYHCGGHSYYPHGGHSYYPYGGHSYYPHGGHSYYPHGGHKYYPYGGHSYYPHGGHGYSDENRRYSYIRGIFFYEESTASCYVIDRASDTPHWEFYVSLPTPMRYHTSVTIKNHIWTVYNMKLYDMNTKTRQIHSFDMPLAITDGHCAVYNESHSFIIGAGLLKNEIWVNTEEYNPAKWHRVGYLREGRKRFGCVWLEDSIFITGGILARADAVVFDLKSYTTTSAGTLVKGRQEHRMVVLEGKPVVMGGFDGNIALNSIETYDESKETWNTSSRSLLAARNAFGVVQLRQ